ncbi:probable protein phosphatase 2C 49 [Lycium ferocissimum]|uniref:probable protein phosphatase 2C 49 n=1 Tax=Lycium ferocissimum TaxID=112874 RepID=UPI0028158056|nr:probable protein phosphatase 2C 49 [Lycium ferocissimum]
MIVKNSIMTKMVVVDADIFCQPSVSVDENLDLFDVSVTKSREFADNDSVSFDIDISSRSDSGVRCSTSTQTTIIDSARSNNFLPAIRSGSYTDIGPRRSNEDEHIRVDDLSAQLGSLYNWPLPGAFYAVFDGHGGSDAAAYIRTNAMRFFFEDANLPRTSVVDQAFLEELESSHFRAFLVADQALADECNVDAYCGTTAITALVLGRHLVVANAGDCRAVLCKKGVAVQLSQDHRPTCLMERQRVEKLGGIIEYGCLNGDLAITRALGDWYMKLPFGSASPLTAEPEVKQTLLTEDDEFMILGCDGIWDVMSNQEAVNVVRHELRLHNDPQQSARELVNQALCKDDTDDNLTAIVVCFTSPDHQTSVPSQRPRFRCCNLSEEARKKLQSLLGSN